MTRYSATYRHTLREAIVILTIWLACFIYSVTFSYLYGYLSHEPDPDSLGTSVSELAGPLHSLDRAPETLSTPLGLGIPDWVFYGLIVPWLVCIAITFWFCLFYFADDDLGDHVDLGEQVEGGADAGN